MRKALILSPLVVLAFLGIGAASGVFPWYYTGTPTNGQVMTYNSTQGAWTNADGGGGGGSPGGSSGQTQYNNSGAFGGYTMGGDGTINTTSGTLTITKSGGVAFGSNAFTSTAYAPLASPTFTGIPSGPTASMGTNTTQLATTAFVLANGGGGGGGVSTVSVVTANGVSGSVANPTTTPAITLTLGAITPSTVNGNTFTSGTGTLTLGSVTLNAGAGGTLGSNAFTSTSYAPLASPALTGTPTSPTATTGTNTIQIATTAFVNASLPGLATNSVVGLVKPDNSSISVNGSGVLTANFPGAGAGYYNFVVNFGGDPTGVADNSAILTAALVTIANAGGGQLFFPAGTYLFSGGLQSTNASNAQVPLPLVPNTVPEVSIELYGAAPPPISDASPNPPLTGCAVFKSTLSSGSGTLPSFMASGTAAFAGRNNLRMYVHDLILLMPDNPPLSGFNFGNQDDVEVRRVTVSAGPWNGTGTTQPTHTDEVALILPLVDNAANTVINSVVANGCFTGLQLGELAVIESFDAQSCVRGCTVSVNLHPNIVLRLGIWECSYGVYYTSAPGTVDYTDFLQIAFEQNTGGAIWQQSHYDLYDPDNCIHGILKWHLSKDHSVQHIFNRLGGHNVNVVEAGTYGGENLAISAQLAVASSTSLDVTFMRPVKAADFTAGVAVTLNGSPDAASAPTVVSPGVVRYTLASPPSSLDVVNWGYTNLAGSIQDGTAVQQADTSINYIQGAGTTLIHDIFNGSNGTALASHTIAPTNTPANSWVDVSPGLKIESNAAAVPAGLGNNGSVVNSGISDGWISCVIMRNNTDVNQSGVIFRSTTADLNDCWAAELDSFTNTFDLFDIVGGTVTHVGTAPFIFTPNVPHTILVRCSGTSITAMVDGANVLTTTSTDNQTRTAHGIYISTDTVNSPSISDFKVVQ